MFEINTSIDLNLAIRNLSLPASDNGHCFGYAAIVITAILAEDILKKIPK